MDKVYTNSSPYMTAETLRSLAEQLHSCTQKLAQLGPITERLRPVYELAQQGCSQYDEAAKCFDTAAGIVPIDGPDAEREFTQAMDCGFTAPSNGGLFFVQADMEGFKIKKAAR